MVKASDNLKTCDSHYVITLIHVRVQNYTLVIISNITIGIITTNEGNNSEISIYLYTLQVSLEFRLFNIKIRIKL